MVLLFCAIDSFLSSRSNTEKQTRSQYDRDMRTATQAEKMRSKLSMLEQHASPPLREALSRVRAVLKGGSMTALEQARDMLVRTEAEAKQGKLQDLQSPSDGNAQEWTRSCEPDCGKEHNVFSGIDTSKYPYDERHGGHKWRKYRYAFINSCTQILFFSSCVCVRVRACVCAHERFGSNVCMPRNRDMLHTSG